jgi:hypothetical protein
MNFSHRVGVARYKAAKPVNVMKILTILCTGGRSGWYNRYKIGVAEAGDHPVERVQHVVSHRRDSSDWTG